MKTYKHKTGVTLVEMLIVVAVIALLATMVIGIAARIDNQGKERLVENTFALLNAALGQFRDYGYNYKVPTGTSDAERDFYRGLVFPVDCNDFTNDELSGELGRVLDLVGEISISGGAHEDEYSGSEALYFFLSKVSESRQTLDKIDRSLISDIGSDGGSMNITIIDVKEYPLLRIIDPWGKTLRYDYYDEDALNFKKMKESKRNFPLITSAGPDGIFNTADDMTNR